VQEVARSGAPNPGRPKLPIVGFGPVAAFAEALRRARLAAENPTYRKMARLCNQSPSALSTADRGTSLPSWECTRAYLLACDVHDDALEEWKQRWDAAGRHARRLTPDLAWTGMMSELCTALNHLMSSLRLTADTVTARIAGLTDPPADCGLSTPPPSAQQIADVLAGGTAVERDLVGYVVFACGGTSTDITYWLKHRDRVQAVAAGAPAGEPTPSDPSAVAPAAPEPPEPGPPSAPGAGAPALRRGLAGRPRWVAAITVAAALAVMAAGADVLFDLDPSEPGDTRIARFATVPDSVRDLPSSPVTARDKLLDLKQHIERAADPRSAGRYTHIHLRTSSRDTTNNDAAQPETFTEEHLWWAADLSGRRSTTISTGAGPGRTPHEERFLPGELPIVVREPASLPDELRRQLTSQQPPDAGAAGTLRAVADLNAFHLLTRAQRGAILQVLAETEGLTYRGLLPDAADRTGIAVSADTQNRVGPAVRDTLIFDPGTGVLLSHETTSIPTPAATGVGTTLGVVLYLGASRTDDLG